MNKNNNPSFPINAANGILLKIFMEILIITVHEIIIVLLFLPFIRIFVKYLIRQYDESKLIINPFKWIKKILINEKGKVKTNE
jgi:hypothetical protein